MEAEPIPLEQRLRELQRVIRVLCVALVLGAGGMAKIIQGVAGYP